MNPQFISTRRYKVGFNLSKEVEANSAQSAIEQVAREVQTDPFGWGIEINVTVFAASETRSATG